MATSWMGTIEAVLPVAGTTSEAEDTEHRTLMSLVTSLEAGRLWAGMERNPQLEAWTSQ